jgi:hypothetical protein
MQNMKCYLSRVVATLLLLVSAGCARADMITPWTYSWSANPISVEANNPTPSGSVNMTVTPLAPGVHMTGDSDINAVNLSTNSSVMGSNDTFTDAPYSLKIHLTDLASSQSGDLTFNGEFNGTLNATTANIATTFLDPKTQTLVLGEHTYTVALNSYVPPGGPPQTVFGSIGAHVSIADSTGGGGGNVHDVPEPSALVLAGLTLPVGLVWWRARRSQKSL